MADSFFEYFPQRGWKRTFLFALVSVLVVFGVYFFISKSAGLASVLHALEHPDWKWFVGAFFGEAAAYLGYVLAFRAVANFGGKRRFSLRLIAHETFVSLGATRLFATAGAGGLAVDYWALRQAGMKQNEAVVRVLAFNTLSYAFFGAAAAFSAIFFLASDHHHFGITLPWIIAVPVCFMLALWVTDPVFGRVITKSRAAGFFGNSFANAVAGVVMVRNICADWRRSWGALAGTPLYWAGDIFALWCGLKAFGYSASLPVLILGYTSGYVATFLPAPTGAEGAVDASMTFALRFLGVPLHISLLGVIVYRVFSFWVPSIPALLLLPTVPRLSKNLQALARQKPAT